MLSATTRVDASGGRRRLRFSPWTNPNECWRSPNPYSKVGAVHLFSPASPRVECGHNPATVSEPANSPLREQMGPETGPLGREFVDIADSCLGSRDLPRHWLTEQLPWPPVLIVRHAIPTERRSAGAPSFQDRKSSWQT